MGPQRLDAEERARSRLLYGGFAWDLLCDLGYNSTLGLFPYGDKGEY